MAVSRCAASHIVGHGRARLTVEYTAAPALQTWLGVQYSGDRPGDAKASFFAPGYAVWNMLQSPGGTSEQAWHGCVEVRRSGNLADLRYVRGLTAADYVWQGERRQVYAFARRLVLRGEVVGVRSEG